MAAAPGDRAREGSEAWGERRERWRGEAAARRYDARRFQGLLGRLKHRRDARLVVALLARAGVPAGGLVLDLPCGTGRMLPELQRAGYAAVGADLSAAMLGEARARRGGAAPLVRAEAERIPFADGAADAAVALRFLFHVEDPAVRRALLAEVARVARVCVLEVAWSGSAKARLRALRGRARGGPAWTRASLERELDAAGLALDRVVPKHVLLSDKAFAVAIAARG